MEVEDGLEVVELLEAEEWLEMEDCWEVGDWLEAEARLEVEDCLEAGMETLSEFAWVLLATASAYGVTEGSRVIFGGFSLPA